MDRMVVNVNFEFSVVTYRRWHLVTGRKDEKISSIDEIFKPAARPPPNVERSKPSLSAKHSMPSIFIGSNR
jgi:hypothetical protein